MAPDGGWIPFPEKAGELVRWEDWATFERRKGYARMFAALTMTMGALVLIAGVVLLIILYEEPISEGPDEVASYIIGMGILLFLFAMAYASADCNTWRMAFFTRGIGLLIPQIGHWELFFVPWSEFNTCFKEDHRHLGPVIRTGYGGQRLFVLGSMDGFEEVEDLLQGELGRDRRPR